MLTVAARDLQYRYRRFLIGVLITALVFRVAFNFDGVKNAVADARPARFAGETAAPARGPSRIGDPVLRTSRRCSC